MYSRSSTTIHYEPIGCVLVDIIWASIDEVLAYRFPQSDNALACRGTHHILHRQARYRIERVMQLQQNINKKEMKSE